MVLLLQFLFHYFKTYLTFTWHLLSDYIRTLCQNELHCTSHFWSWYRA